MVDLRKMSGRVKTGKSAGSYRVRLIFPCSHSRPLATAGCAQQCGREINAGARADGRSHTAEGFSGDSPPQMHLQQG